MSPPRCLVPAACLLLLLCAQLCRVAPTANELRCQCTETVSKVIRPKLIAHVELIPEGPHCEVPEVIATLKNGKQVCLEPKAPWVKLIITKILNSTTPKNS